MCKVGVACTAYTRVLLPLVLQCDAKGDSKRKAKMESYSYSENSGKEDKDEGNGEGSHTEGLVKATTLG